MKTTREILRRIQFLEEFNKKEDAYPFKDKETKQHYINAAIAELRWILGDYDE